MYQLDGSHVFFPPQKLLEAWSSSSQSVVEIHDDVDGRVHHCMERPHSTCGYNEKINKLMSSNKMSVIARTIKKAEDTGFT